MFPFHGVDFMEIDSSLNDEEELVRQTVREFVDQEVIPHIEDWYREGKFPLHLAPAMGELGLLGANLTGYGCAEMSNVQYGLIMQELERADSGLRSFVSVQTSLVMHPIHEYGSAVQKQRWLPAMHQGMAVGCLGLSEPDFGSNPGGMRSRAVKDGDHYVLNGEKTWITNGTIADVALVWARTPEGVRGFLVEKGTPGFTTKDIKGKMSLRASVTSSLSLQDVRVPAANMLPGAKGLKAPLDCLTQARYGITWGPIGAAIPLWQPSTPKTAGDPARPSGLTRPAADRSAPAVGARQFARFRTARPQGLAQHERVPRGVIRRARGRRVVGHRQRGRPARLGRVHLTAGEPERALGLPEGQPRRRLGRDDRAPLHHRAARLHAGDHDALVRAVPPPACRGSAPPVTCRLNVRVRAARSWRRGGRSAEPGICSAIRGSARTLTCSRSAIRCGRGMPPSRWRMGRRS